MRWLVDWYLILFESFERVILLTGLSFPGSQAKGIGDNEKAGKTHR